MGRWFSETAVSTATTPASPTAARHVLGAPLPALLLVHAAVAMPTSRCANNRGRLHQAVRCTECRRLWPYCTFCNALLYGDTCTCGGFETPTCETDDEAETVFGVSDSEEEREDGSSQEHALLPPPPPPEVPPPPPPEVPPPPPLEVPPPESPPPTGGTGTPIPFNGLLFAAMSFLPDITTRSGFDFYSSVRNRNRSAPVSPSSGYWFKSRFRAGIFRPFRVGIFGSGDSATTENCAETNRAIVQPTRAVDEGVPASVSTAQTTDGQSH